MKNYIIPFSELTMGDVATVGGKNASLGEMIRSLSSLGVAVPNGFAVTVDAFHDFLAFNALCPQLQQVVDRLDRESLENLSEVGEECRALIMRGSIPSDVSTSIAEAYQALEKQVGKPISVAVRSSATAE